MDRLYEQRARGDSSLPDPAVAPGDITMAVAESLKDHPDPISEIRSMFINYLLLIVYLLKNSKSTKGFTTFNHKVKIFMT